MKILARAKPSKRYRWYNSISDLILQARLVGGRVIYYELHESDSSWSKSLSQDQVKAMFPKGKRIKDQPFLKKENRDFYTVLHRRKEKYKAAYQLLLEDIPKFVRTKTKKTTARKKVEHHLQDELDKVIADLIKDTDYIIDGIQGYIADVQRGRSFAQQGEFTVPYWAYKDKRKGYFIHYVAHELSHQLRYKRWGKERGKSHDDKFYVIYTDICPVEYQHYEVDYKPTSVKHGVSTFVRTKFKRTKFKN